MKRIIVIAALVLIGILIIGATFYLTPIGTLAHIRAMEFKLLHRTNHEQLLSACRTVMADPRKYRKNPHIHPGSDDGYFPDPTDLQMPAAIRSLGCHYIQVREKSMSIEMGGGFYHFGVVASDSEAPPTKMRELIKGLYFYSESGG